jgi:hypothetical protein
MPRLTHHALAGQSETSRRLNYYIRAYSQHMTTENLTGFLEMAAANEPVISLIEGLRACRRDKRCELLGCPKCGPRRQERTAYKSLNRLWRLRNDWPKPSSVSWVTIRGPLVDLEAIDISGPWNSFRKKLRNVRGRYLQQASLYGYIDVSLAGRIHFHGWIVHGDLPRARLVELLKTHFGRGKKVHVADWCEDEPLAANLHRTILYSLERRPRLPHRYAELEPGQLSRLIGLQLLATNLVTGRGYVGSRVSLGMRLVDEGPNKPLPPRVKRDVKPRRPPTPWFSENVPQAKMRR